MQDQVARLVRNIAEDTESTHSNFDLERHATEHSAYPWLEGGTASTGTCSSAAAPSPAPRPAKAHRSVALGISGPASHAASGRRRSQDANAGATASALDVISEALGERSSNHAQRASGLGGALENAGAKAGVACASRCLTDNDESSGHSRPAPSAALTDGGRIGTFRQSWQCSDAPEASSPSSSATASTSGGCNAQGADPGNRTQRRRPKAGPMQQPSVTQQQQVATGVASNEANTAERHVVGTSKSSDCTWSSITPPAQLSYTRACYTASATPLSSSDASRRTDDGSCAATTPARTIADLDNLLQSSSFWKS